MTAATVNDADRSRRQQQLIEDAHDMVEGANRTLLDAERVRLHAERYWALSQMRLDPGSVSKESLDQIEEELERNARDIEARTA